VEEIEKRTPVDLVVKKSVGDLEPKGFYKHFPEVCVLAENCLRPAHALCEVMDKKMKNDLASYWEVVVSME
jgi:hypothetical protein